MTHLGKGKGAEHRDGQSQNVGQECPTHTAYVSDSAMVRI
jgi:hypothetical protein